MACLGTFTAQHFKLLSIDPNTIFQFFVFPDRLFTVKAGTALNQLPQVLTRGAVKGAVGLQDHAVQGLPTVEEARQLVTETSKAKAMSLDSPVKSRELPYSLVERAELSTKGMFSKGLTLRLRGGGELFFRFLDTAQQERAVELLGQALGPRFTAR
jgi:hypothetical protein